MSAGSVGVDIQEVLQRLSRRVGELELRNAMLEATNGALQARVIELESVNEDSEESPAD